MEYKGRSKDKGSLGEKTTRQNQRDEYTLQRVYIDNSKLTDKDRVSLCDFFQLLSETLTHKHPTHKPDRHQPQTTYFSKRSPTHLDTFVITEIPQKRTQTIQRMSPCL